MDLSKDEKKNLEKPKCAKPFPYSLYSEFYQQL